jgi:hypothetical protein
MVMLLIRFLWMISVCSGACNLVVDGWICGYLKKIKSLRIHVVPFFFFISQLSQYNLYSLNVLIYTHGKTRTNQLMYTPKLTRTCTNTTPNRLIHHVLDELVPNHPIIS